MREKIYPNQHVIIVSIALIKPWNCPCREDWQILLVQWIISSFQRRSCPCLKNQGTLIWEWDTQEVLILTKKSYDGQFQSRLQKLISFHQSLQRKNKNNKKPCYFSSGKVLQIENLFPEHRILSSTIAFKCSNNIIHQDTLTKSKCPKYIVYARPCINDLIFSETKKAAVAVLSKEERWEGQYQR